MAFRKAWEKAPPVLRLLQDLRLRKPTLFRRLLLSSSKEVLINLPQGVTAEDIGFFVGRCIKVGVAMPEAALGPIIRMMAKTAVQVGALQAPGMAAHGIQAAAAKQEEQLEAQLAAQGIHVSLEEARTILHEIMG